MGFLLFAFRKISLRRQIDRKEFRLTTISNKILQLQDQQSILAQAKTSAQNSLSMFFKSNSSLAESFFQSKMYSLNNAVSQKQSNYTSVFNQYNGDTSNSEVVKAQNEYQEAQMEATRKAQTMYADYQAAQTALQMSSQVMNSVFTKSDENQAANLHSQETQLTTEKESLESSLKVLNKEYEGVAQAEEQEAKNVAPKFGLSG